MTLKKVTGKIHLWLGLFSGIVVLVVSITGAILVFEHEVMKITGAPFVHENPRRAIDSQDAPYLKPSVLIQKLDDKFPGSIIWGVSYHRGFASTVWGYDTVNKRDIDIILNPYSGKEAPERTNVSMPEESKVEKFFHLILDGHLHLWLPHEIGKPIVDYCTLIFLVMLITGIILWWPKNRAAGRQRFKFQWKPTTKWKRKNYDLHNVLGFYMTWIAVFIIATGLVMAFEWFGRGWYFLLSAGGSPPIEISKPATYIAANPTEAADKIWQRYFQNDPEFDGWMEIYFMDEKGSIMYRKQHTSGEKDEAILNLYTLEKRRSENVVADAVLGHNYSIHVGEIGGLPTKVLAFFASLIAASLPITGFYIWWGRRNKNIKTTAVKKTAGSGK